VSKSSNPPLPPWKIDPFIDVDRISLDDVKFVFAQAEKRLDDTVKRGELIANRTITLMTLMTGVLIALSGFFVSNWNGWPVLNAKTLVSFVGAIYMLSIVTYMLKNILSNEYYVLGSKPRELMSPNFYSPFLSSDRIVIFMYMSEIESYDFRIDHNSKINDASWKRFRHSLIALWLMPMILGILYMGYHG